MAKTSLERELLKALSLIRKGNLADAEKIYLSILERFPKNTRAKEALKKIKKSKPIPKNLSILPVYLKNELANLYNGGNFRAALERAKLIAKEFPNSHQIHNFLGIFAARLQESILSESSFRKALSLNSDYADAHNNLGNILKSKGNLDDAQDHFKLALTINPLFAQAHNNLANLLMEKNLALEAIEYYHKALEINPKYPEALNNLGYAIESIGQIDNALKYYKKAIEMRSNYPEAYNNLGNALQKIGKLDLAIINFEKAVNLNMYYYKSRLNLAKALSEILNNGEAIEVLEATIKIFPEKWEAHEIMGAILRKINQPAKAVEFFRNVEKINKNNQKALLNIAICLQDLGNNKDALMYLRKVIKKEPLSAEAYHMITLLKKYSPEDPDIRQIENIYNIGLSKEKHLKICFAMAKVYDDLDNLNKAFNFLQEGNDENRKLLGYEIHQDERLFQTVIASTKQIKQNSLSLELDRSSPTPIFILGMPRSGTTLIEQIISSHSKVTGGGELEDINFHALSLYKNKSFSAEAVKLFRTRYLKKLASISMGNPFVTDKMPQNFLHICLICTAFPEAKIIHVTRDPAAICWSNFKNYFANGLSYSYNLNDIMTYYTMYLDLMKLWQLYYNKHIYHLNYDKLTLNQVSETKKLIKHLNLKWEEECLTPENNSRSIRTASQGQVRDKVYTGSSNEWKRYKRFLPSKFEKLEAWKD